MDESLHFSQKLATPRHFEDEKLKAFIGPWRSQSSNAYQLLPTLIRVQTLDTGVQDIPYKEGSVLRIFTFMAVVQ